MSKNNNLIRKEIWLTKEECQSLASYATKESSTPKRILEMWVAEGLASIGCATAQERVYNLIALGTNKGARKSPLLSPKVKKLRKVKGVLVHQKGSTEKEGQTVMPLK